MGYGKGSFGKISSALGHRYADGGKMNDERPVSQSPARPFGLTEFDTGGSHEENRYGGIPQGIAPDGAPNLVEEGEVKLGSILGQDNQYVLSNRIVLDAEHAEEFGIPQSVVGETYASAFKKLIKGLKERSGSAEVRNEIAHLANAFMESQDSMKAEQEARMASRVMASLPPEAQAQMEQAAAQAQQAQAQQAQAQMMAQQGGMPQEAMGGGAPQPGMPPEAMGGGQAMMDPAMGGGGMAPEAMGGDPMMGADQPPMMARGGFINTFSKGGKMRNMFNGVFAHRFDNGGRFNESEAERRARRLDVQARTISNIIQNGRTAREYLYLMEKDATPEALEQELRDNKAFRQAHERMLHRARAYEALLKKSLPRKKPKVTRPTAPEGYDQPLTPMNPEIPMSDVAPGSEEMDEILRRQNMGKRYYDGQ